jgi:cell division cycle 20-like protein 1 (cofactor of APC complex)
MLIRSELLPDHEARPTPVTPTHRQPVGSPTASAAPISFSSPTAARTLRFKAPLQSSILDEVPLSAESRQLLNSPTKAVRKIAKQPFKVLDAPALQDDFYLNLVDWSAQNVLAVGLGPSVYLWAANTGKVTRLCDLTDSEDSVSSLAFTNKVCHYCDYKFTLRYFALTFC